MSSFFFLFSGLLFLLMNGPALAQVKQPAMTPDERVRQLFLFSATWGPDSIPGLRRIDSVRAVAQKLGDERLFWYANLHRIMCRVCAEDALDRLRGKISKLRAHDRIITGAFAEQCPVPMVRAAFYCAYGRWCYQGDELEKGLGYMFRGRRMLEKIGYANIPEAVNYLTLFGHHYYYHGEYQKAIDYLEQIKKFPNPGLVLPSAYLNTLGLAYTRLKKYDRAEPIFRDAIRLAQADHHDDWVAIATGNLGNTLRLIGRNREALPMLYADVALTKKGVPTSSATTCFLIAQALTALDSTAKAATYIAHGRRLQNDPTDPGFRAHYYLAQTRYFKKTGDYRLALLYQDSTLLFNESLREATQSKLLTNAEHNMNAEQYLSDMRQVETEKESALAIRNLSLGILSVLLISLVVGLVQYRTIRRTNSQLSDKNRLIEEKGERLAEQSEQLQTLMRELHHRVKNNLAIVSSLLNLQTYRLSDTEAIEAVQESQRRVEAMSLIHQRLYRTDAVTTIDMAHYITDLVESLMAAYGFEPDQFDLTIRVEDPEVDVDVAIPMGLILNELLTNAFKYAYSSNGHRIGGRKRPALHIALHQTDGLTLEVQDNGPGLDLSQWHSPDAADAPAEASSFGHQLIASLTEQIGGTLTVENRNGAYFQVMVKG